MQQRAALWISCAFYTLPTAGIEAISGLILIHLHLKKLYDKFHLRGYLLPLNHIIKSIINSNGSNNHTKYYLALNSLTPKQIPHLSSLLIDIDNRYNEFLLSFSLFNREFSLENWLIDTFPDCFSFNLQTHNVKNYLHKLEDITIQASSDSSLYVIIFDASIKNHIATSVLHIYSFDRLIIKTCHHAVNISTTETKLFTMRCGIN